MTCFSTKDLKIQRMDSHKQNPMPQEVSMQDLIRREAVQVDTETIRHWIDDKTIMITGSAGSIGSELSQQVLQFFSPKRLVLVDRSETGQFYLERMLNDTTSSEDTQVSVLLADILDRNRIKSIMNTHELDIIFHTAAYKHVPLLEAHPGEAVKNIVLATRQLVDLSRDCGVHTFVFVSTDKAVNPTSVMGACKRVAELYVQAQTDGSSDCRFVTVRFGNVLDSAGSVVPIFRQQIARGGPVTVTHPRMERFFMTIPEAARLVIQAGAIGKDGDILSLDMGNPVRIVDLASDMIRLSGLEVGKDIQIVYIGLRPGEKLQEELHSHDEEHVDSTHPKIKVVQQNGNSRRSNTAIELIEQMLQHVDDDPETILSILELAVPQYSRHGTAGSIEQIEPN